MDIGIAETIINQFNEDDDIEFRKKCFLISQDVKEGRLVVVDLIEQLQNLFLNHSPTKRVLGILILNEILKNLPTGFFNDRELKTISLFYTEKLNDHHHVLPAVLQGLLIIIKFKHFPGEVSRIILNAIFHNVACQQQQQTDRQTIYAIFQVLLDEYKIEVLSMDLDFVYGVISSIDGERDPKNLLFLLKWLKTFLTTVSLGHLVEEMFEIIACYFPIDFRASSVNSHNVSRETLADALRLCLCAIPEFAEYCIPLALEKLDSSLEIAKIDSLNLLEEGCNTFDVSSYITYGLKIWSQIQKEVFSGVPNNVNSKCLRTLTAIMSKISLTTDGYFKSILNDISMTLKGNLLPDAKLFAPSTDILLHTALASRVSADYIIKEIVPLLTNTFSITTTPEKKSVILKTLTRFVKAYQTQYDIVNLNEVEELEIIPILSLKSLTELDSNLRITGFDSLSELVEKLPLNVRLTLYKIMQESIIKPEEELVRVSILNCFKHLSNTYQDEIKDHVFFQSKINDPLILDLYLNALSVIANLNYFRNIFTDILLTYAIDDVCLSVIALKNMKNLLESIPSDSLLVKMFLEKETINKLTKYAVQNAVIQIHRNETYELLQYISSVIKILIGAQDYETQNKIINHQLNVIVNCKEQSKEVYVFLLDGLLSRLRRVPSFQFEIIDLLTKVSLIHEHDIVRDIATQLLANLINKLSDDDELNKYLTTIKVDYLQNADFSKFNTIATISWITKALVMRNHFQGNLWITWLLDMLEQDSKVAKGFKIIMDDSYDSLSLKSYCNKTLLYRQKFFVVVTEKLTLNYELGKSSYLYAIGYLLEFAPEQVILLQFKKILKLVILCLEHCNDVDILCIILNIIKDLTRHNEEVIQENLEDFILRILNLTTFEHSMKVRIAALQCLSGYTVSLPLYRILPFKQKVLHQLGFCIDDKKRLVRKEAMEARSAWFLIDAPI